MAEPLNLTILEWILLAIAAVAVLGLFGWLKFRRDERVVADFLRDSGVDTRKPYRSTFEISDATDLHEDRVRTLCKKSPRIGAKHDDEDAWKLHD